MRVLKPRSTEAAGSSHVRGAGDDDDVNGSTAFANEMRRRLRGQSPRCAAFEHPSAPHIGATNQQDSYQRKERAKWHGLEISSHA